AKGPVGPLHCVPVLLKDNFDTADMPTTVGSKNLEKSVPLADGTVVKKLRQAGALILAKMNMHELASGGVTVSSMGGQTKNPYDLGRTPGGSSGGTGAGIAANFGVLGTGSDTVNSIRSPASATNLVGFRPTKGLISLSGVAPVSATQDAAGPITRTVEDNARMLNVMAGYDPADPLTAWSVGQTSDYTKALNAGALKGARIGVLRTLFGIGPQNEEVNKMMDKALAALKAQGAVLIDIMHPAIDSGKIIGELDVQKWELKENFNNYLASLGPNAPVKDLSDFIAKGQYHKPSLEKTLVAANSLQDPLNEAEYKDRQMKIRDLRQVLMTLMADQQLDAFVYPLQKRLVVPIPELDQAERTGILASMTGFPAIDVPAGFSTPTAAAPLGVPVGMDILGKPWSEAKLIGFAYAFEQATKMRRPPQSTPPLAK
ncbi:MAG TPA: amidase family protein, partial [Candidatus Baltobacteraceae bacterium]|nr:amidase family protein [Candidatus Baltobacteraceae bacterium]